MGRPTSLGPLEWDAANEGRCPLSTSKEAKGIQAEMHFPLSILLEERRDAYRAKNATPGAHLL
jgi:hypothetical protein